MRKMFAGLLLAAAAGIFVAGAAQAETIKIGGAGSALGGMRLLGKAFEQSHPGVKIEVFPSLGSSGGIKAALAGSLDLAVSGRQLKAEEQKAGGSAVEYGTTPFVFATNPTVKKEGISSAELEKIYQGQLIKWPDGSQIRLVLRPDSDTDTKIIKSISPALSEAAKTASSRPGMIYAVTDQDCDEAITKTPGAVGPSTLAEISTEKRKVHILTYNGVKPTVKAFLEGKYPLSKPHFIVSTPKSSPVAREFAQFVVSPKGRAILSKAGFVDPASVKRK